MLQKIVHIDGTTGYLVRDCYRKISDLLNYAPRLQDIIAAGHVYMDSEDGKIYVLRESTFYPSESPVIEHELLDYLMGVEEWQEAIEPSRAKLLHELGVCVQPKETDWRH